MVLIKRFFSNPGPLSQGEMRMWIFLYQVGFTSLSLVLGYIFGTELRTTFLNWVGVAAIFVPPFLFGVIIAPLKSGWIFSTLADIGVSIGAAGFLGADIATDLSSTTFQMGIALFIAVVIYTTAILITKKAPELGLFLPVMLMVVFVLSVTIIPNTLIPHLGMVSKPLRGTEVFVLFWIVYNICFKRIKRASEGAPELNRCADSFIDLFLPIAQMLLTTYVGRAIRFELKEEAAQKGVTIELLQVMREISAKGKTADMTTQQRWAQVLAEGGGLFVEQLRSVSPKFAQNFLDRYLEKPSS